MINNKEMFSPLNYDYPITHINSKSFKDEFLRKDKIFRIEAVIHDGQYYTIEKWAKVAKVLEKEIIDYIKTNNKIIASKKGSYRTDFDTIINWYDKNNLKLSDPIVPGNFVPKLWNGKTEVEYFELTPRILLSSLSFTCSNENCIKKIYTICDNYGKLHREEGNKFYLHTLDSEFVKSKLLKELGPNIKYIENLRLRTKFYHRETLLFPNEFLYPFFKFYLAYSIGMLKSHIETLNMFIPEKDDRISVIYNWILVATQKFDETLCVPFSGYLSNVLSKWPYDLPDQKMGKRLSTYQRKKRKAEAFIKANKNTEDIDIEEIIEYLKDFYTREEVISLEEDYQKWYIIKHKTSLVWSDNGSEKRGSKLFTHKTTKRRDLKMSHIISLALLKTTKETKNIEVLLNILKQFGNDSIDLTKLGDIPKDFKNSLKIKLKNELSQCEEK